MSCNKVSPDGHKCEREVNHEGRCCWHEGTIYHIFQPGWISQGNRPARRELLTMIVCGVSLIVIIGWMLVTIQGIMQWVLIGCTVLMGVMLVITPNRLGEIWRNYKQEIGALKSDKETRSE